MIERKRTGSVHHAVGGRLEFLSLTGDGAIRRVKNAGIAEWRSPG